MPDLLVVALDGDLARSQGTRRTLAQLLGATPQQRLRLRQPHVARHGGVLARFL
jgi:hypothetical protein